MYYSRSVQIKIIKKRLSFSGTETTRSRSQIVELSSDIRFPRDRWYLIFNGLVGKGIPQKNVHQHDYKESLCKPKLRGGFRGSTNG